MKKNLITVIILALGLINLVLTAVIVFAVVPTTIKTNNLITKVATSIDLELQSPIDNGKESSVDMVDTEEFAIAEDITANLQNSTNDTQGHYALVNASLSINKKSEDYATLQPMLEPNVNAIREIITEECSKYTKDTILENKVKIKEEILKRLQEKFQSDFIVEVSFGKFIVE